jgi:predicted transcriptional regulator
VVAVTLQPAGQGSAPDATRRNTTMQVHMCMRAPAVTCGPEDKLVEVARQMESENVGSLVVTDN